MPSAIHRPAGFLRVATIVRTDPSTMTAFISFRPTNSGLSITGTDGSKEAIAQLPISYLSSGGGFIGGVPANGTPVIVSQAEGASHYFIVAFLAKDPSAKTTTNSTQIKIPQIVRNGETDTIIIQANTNGGITLNSDAIVMGQPPNAITLDITRKLPLNTFDQSY